MDYLLFGAGEVGMEFLESESFRSLQGNQICFYDNKKAPVTLGNLKRIENFNDIDKNCQVIITCRALQEVYQQCIREGVFNVRIYDAKADKILTIREYCKRNSVSYRNQKRVEYLNCIEKKKQEGARIFKETHNIYDNMNTVAIMLSNLCNYASIHTKCPASCVKEKEIMPSKTVYKILDELAQDDFSGTILFHLYNEPLIDPRLFLFIQYAKRVMPDCTILVYSNGYYLNQVMVDELQEIGTDVLVTTSYGYNEHIRLIDLEVDIAFEVFFGRLDDRLDFYEKVNSAGIHFQDSCRTYIDQIPIYSNGDIGTCCLDYKHPYALGNVTEHSLKDCLSNKRVVDFQLNLLNGDRSNFPICSNCGWAM